MPSEGGPENVANFGSLSTLTLNLTHPRKKGDNSLRANIIILHLSNLIREFKSAPCPVLCICTWLPTPRREFWHLRVLLDTKIIPSKRSFFEINFLCGISLIAASIWAKNERLTPWIDKDMKFWNVAPSTNLLKMPKCTTFGTFLQAFAPPQAILRASFYGQLLELNSRYTP